MRALGRPALVPAALALAAYSGLAVWAGAQLLHTGAVVLYSAAAILALAAVGVAFGQLWGRAFALVFFVATALVYGYAVVELVRGVIGDSSSADWAQARHLVLLGVAAIAIAGFLVSVTFGFLLVRVGREERGEGLLSHALAWPLALAGVGVVAWLVGHQYAYRMLPLQDACLSGQAGRCYGLARDARFSPSERLSFARHGCQGGSTNACMLVAGQLGAAMDAQSPEALVLARKCEGGDADVCLRLGGHLLKVVRDREGAAKYLSQACEAMANRCDQAAKVAEAQGESALALSVLRRGCERDDPRSCTQLLRKMGPSVPQADRDAFHLRVCLLTDVNECLPLIRRDAAAFCPVICEGARENRMQSCDHCGRHAAKSGQRALAEAWFGGNCEKGYPLSCVNLGLMYDELGQRNLAAPWFSKACDRSRNVTLGCHYLERPSPSRTGMRRPP